MKSFEVIQMFKDTVATTKAKGVEHVPIKNLEAFADELQEVVESTPEDVAAGEAAMEEYRAHLTAWVSSSQHRHEKSLEILRAGVTAGQSALKSALLINGGAAVALLAFIGKIWGDVDTQPVLDALATALIFYVSGVLSAAMASGATYFSQAGFADEFGPLSQRVGGVGRVAAVGFVFGGYAFFGTGSWIAFKAMGLN